jgi:hypothetical protein
MPIGHEAGVTSSASECSVSSKRSNGVAALAVELVDEGQDRHVAQPAELEELAGLLLAALLVPLRTITALFTAVRMWWVSFLNPLGWNPGGSACREG